MTKDPASSEATEKLISIVVPFFNEASNLAPLCAELASALSGLPYRFEIILVNDGSTDDFEVTLRQLERDDPRLRSIEFVRNFGKEIAVTAGLNACVGEAAIVLDADLQHPPAKIPEFLEKWEGGAEVVVGLREGYKPNFVRRLGARFFYRILNRISQTALTPDSTDFRLLDRAVLDEFQRFTERNRITRGLIDWLGFRRGYVSFAPGERRNGAGTYGLSKLVKLAMNSFVAMSLFPLKAAGYLGMIITLFAGSLGLFILFENYVFSDPWDLRFSGPAILAVILLFLVGIVLMALGLIALYIANIHVEVVNRPLYVVRKRQR